MQCYSPTVLKDTGQRVPCGWCKGCMIKRREEWALRNYHENAMHDKSVFCTFTYSPEHLPAFKSLRLEDLQKYLKRLRKQTDHPIRYYASGEYGDPSRRLYGDKFTQGERPHYHAIIYGLGLQDKKHISMHWGLGMVHFGTVTPDSIRYVCKYVNKKYHGEKENEVYTSTGRIASFCVASKGIGKDYVDKYIDELQTDKMHMTLRGKHLSFPRYYFHRLGMVPKSCKGHIDSVESKVIEEVSGLSDLTIDQAYKHLSVDQNVMIEKRLKAVKLNQELHQIALTDLAESK